MPISQYLPDFGGVFSTIWVFLVHGGWLLFVWLVIQILYMMYRAEIEHQFIHSQQWVFLQIKVPKENLVSTLAVESIFSQMHALHASLTFAQIYVEGRTQLWHSLEIVSLGGKISYIIRTPKKTKDLVEASFYSHYPDAEITEIRDYMENIEYDPETSDFDVWGTEWKYTDKTDVIPFKTYRDFEHPSAEEKIIEPLAGFFEAMAKMEPHEFYGVQIIIQPLGDEEWKPRGEAKIKELIGEDVPHETGWSDIFLAPLNWVAHFSFKDTVLGGGHGHGGHGDENKPKNNWQFMTEAEKLRVGLIEQKIGKPGYKVKLRHMYIAPKEKFDGTKKGLVIGSYRPLGSAMTNKLKPDTKRTWTGLEYAVSPTLEAPFLNYELKRRKKNIFKGYKDRDIHLGNPMQVMNIEEIATLYHFPLSTKPVGANIDKTDSKKAQAPMDLPIAEM